MPNKMVKDNRLLENGSKRLLENRVQAGSKPSAYPKRKLESKRPR